jgi:HlyD family secretion protein
MGGKEIFREKSLERLSSPERLDQLMRVVDRRSWLPLAALGVLVTLLVLWAVFGRVPVNVHGQGILMYPRAIVEFHAPGAGYLVELYVTTGDEVQPQQVLGEIARPDLDLRWRQQQDKRRELLDVTHVLLDEWGAEVDMREVETRSGDGVARDLELWRELAAELRERERQSLQRENDTLQEQLRLAEQMSASQKDRWSDQQRLFEEQALAKHDVIDAEESYMEALVRQQNVEISLRELQTRRLEVEERFLNRLQRISDRGQEIADVEREIAAIDAAIRQETRIVSEHGGRILEINVADGEYVAAGARVGTMAAGSGVQDLVGYLFFSVRDGKRLAPEMRVQVTPNTVERERYGSIYATITDVSSFPVTQAEVEKVVGNRHLAEAFVGSGLLMEVQARLRRDPATVSGYEWSSSDGPPLVFSAGTTTTARVAVEQRSPITFVLPFLRSAAGID